MRFVINFAYYLCYIVNVGKESVIENLRIVIGVLTRLVSYPHLMVTSQELLNKF